MLADQWAMVTVQRASADNYLDLVVSLHGETTTAIWQDILGRLGMIDALQRGQPGARLIESA